MQLISIKRTWLLLYRTQVLETSPPGTFSTGNGATTVGGALNLLLVTLTRYLQLVGCMGKRVLYGCSDFLAWLFRMTAFAATLPLCRVPG